MSHPNTLRYDNPLRRTLVEGLNSGQIARLGGIALTDLPLRQGIAAVLSEIGIATLPDVACASIERLMDARGVSSGDLHLLGRSICLRAGLTDVSRIAYQVAEDSPARLKLGDLMAMRQGVDAALATSQRPDGMRALFARYSLGSTAFADDEADLVRRLMNAGFATLHDVATADPLDIVLILSLTTTEQASLRRMVETSVGTIQRALQTGFRVTDRRVLETACSRRYYVTFLRPVWGLYETWCKAHGLDPQVLDRGLVHLFIAETPNAQSRGTTSVMNAMALAAQSFGRPFKADHSSLEPRSTEVGPTVRRITAPAKRPRTMQELMKTARGTSRTDIRAYAPPSRRVQRPADAERTTRRYRSIVGDDGVMPASRMAPLNGLEVRNRAALALHYATGIEPEALVDVSLDQIRQDATMLYVSLHAPENPMIVHCIPRRGDPYGTYSACVAWLRCAEIHDGLFLRNIRNSRLYEHGLVGRSLRKHFSAVRKYEPSGKPVPVPPSAKIRTLTRQVWAGLSPL